MKKILINIILFAVFMLFPASVFASGNISVSPSSLTVEVGSSKTFTITATNTIGDVSISSSNSGIARVSTGEWGTGMVDEGQTKSGTITVTGVSEGTATITLTLDAATFDGEDLAGQSRTVTVTVVAKSIPAPSSPTTNNNDTSTNTNNNPSNSNVSNRPANTDNRSGNNNIKELSVEGYELTKVDNNNYTLSVPNDVTSVNIKATAEDAKAKITGDGNHDIDVGDNNIEVIVTAENGLQNKINIKVTRKDGYYLEDLDSALNNNKLNDINIIINSDTIINSQDLEKIKSSKKSVKFNCYDENKRLLYSWIVDGSKLSDASDFVTSISYDSENKKDMLRLSNYADGLFMSFKQIDNMSNGIKIKLYVGDKYNNDDLVNVYSYIKNSDKLSLIKNKTKVEDGYIEFDIVNASDYVVTMSTIPNSNRSVIKEGETASISLSIVIGIIGALIVIGIIVFILIRKRSRKKENNIIGDNNYKSLNEDASEVLEKEFLD